MNQIELITNQLDKIYLSVEEICKAYETTTPSLNLINKVLSDNKLNVSKGVSKGESDYYKLYNNLLNSISKACKDQASQVGSSKLPLKTFKMFIDLTKENIIKGSQNK